MHITEELGELPKLIRVLGEDLVLFRYDGDKYGLVHKHCPHRRASLEYGKCEPRGIRCCYHGWLFAADGEILETPGEAPDAEAAARVRARTRLGAYPVIEFNGLIFAYMGPPDQIPEFPIYDAFRIPDQVTRPYKAPYTLQLGAGARRHHGPGAHDLPAQPDQSRAVFRGHGRTR